MLDIVELNGNKYKFDYYYNMENKELISMIGCSKIVGAGIAYFGQAIYDESYKVVFCKINYWDVTDSSYIDITKEKENLTKVLNMAKKEILEKNNI